MGVRRGRAKRMRALAWTALGVSAAGLILAVVSEAQSSAKYGDPLKEGSFQYARAKLLANDETYRAQATALQGEVQTWNTLAIVGIVVGLAGAGTSAVLFIIGEDPAKYDQFHRAAPKSKTPTVSLSPTLNGMVLSGTF